MKISKTQKDRIKKIAEKYKLRFVLLYGSCARGEENETSDMDVAVHGNYCLKMKDLLGIQADLFDIFTKEGREIDLVTIEDKDPLFMREIVRDAQLLCGDQDDYDNYEAYVLRNFLFNKKIFELEDLLIEKAAKSI